ncbi:AAA family ATPase [Bailinhaonella thermotolerans]|uniref:Cytidylate kinase-like family protein n=1 Tax=Bailinhaonella thermotolerans TaxID=1070861 RepID=A0A3A4A7H4_9ACTN|nr:cytidylate kinase-like family protein [Bailinhaonella thermotolerans]RJL24535.1 cytidylate kinase-like family protein [Bailinhaonella thermotolerans]
MRVVTISAGYGTGGSVIGPAVAERLDVPFVDRAIPSAVAEEIGCSLEEALAHDDRAEHGLGRLLSGAARLPTVTFGGIDVYLPEASYTPEEEFVARTEKVIKETVRRRGGVVLGRAGAIVLKDEPNALHVRLCAPVRRRVAQTMAISGVSEREARRMVEETDRARGAYVKHFYRADMTDPSLYHLMIDSTVIAVPACVDMIVTAVESLDR